MPGKCRFCGHPLTQTFVDLGMSPLSNRYLSANQLNQMEPFYPLHAYVCEKCLLVQVEEFEAPEQIFSDYAYFSSYSDSWLRHSQHYVNAVASRFRLDASSHVIEIASNDGYLLRFFKERGIPVLGIEPAANIAQAAERAGIRTLVRFFSAGLAEELVAQTVRADLLIGNNVLAHVPNLNDFVHGMKRLLAPRGVITMEFPHVLRMIEDNQFDTIYHEHFSYFSFTTVEKVFAAHGLALFDVEELPTHGGSLRIYASQADDDTKPIQPSVHAFRKKEAEAGATTLSLYRSFSERVRETKRKLLDFLITAKQAGKSIAGYGAAAKGNTLLNYCGIRTDFLDYIVDRSPHKQGRYLPGTHIPVYAPEHLAETRPDYVLILPWNLRDEIINQMSHIRSWGGKFVVPIPVPAVLE